MIWSRAWLRENIHTLRSLYPHVRVIVMAAAAAAVHIKHFTHSYISTASQLTTR